MMRYLLLLEGGLVCVGIINFAAVSFFSGRFAWEWVLQTVSTGFAFSYVWWTYNEIKIRRELRKAYIDFYEGRKSYEEVYPIFVKHTPKDGILNESRKLR